MRDVRWLIWKKVRKSERPEVWSPEKPPHLTSPLLWRGRERQKTERPKVRKSGVRRRKTEDGSLEKVFCEPSFLDLVLDLILDLVLVLPPFFQLIQPFFRNIVVLAGSMLRNLLTALPVLNTLLSQQSPWFSTSGKQC